MSLSSLPPVSRAVPLGPFAPIAVPESTGPVARAGDPERAVYAAAINGARRPHALEGLPRGTRGTGVRWLDVAPELRVGEMEVPSWWLEPAGQATSEVTRYREWVQEFVGKPGARDRLEAKRAVNVRYGLRTELIDALLVATQGGDNGVRISPLSHLEMFLMDLHVRARGREDYSEVGAKVYQKGDRLRVFLASSSRAALAIDGEETRKAEAAAVADGWVLRSHIHNHPFGPHNPYGDYGGTPAPSGPDLRTYQSFMAVGATEARVTNGFETIEIRLTPERLRSLQSASGTQVILPKQRVTVPPVALDRDARAAQLSFRNDLLEVTASMRDALGPSQFALAPFGGSRVSPLAELDLRGMVIIDMAPAGSKAKILESFRDPDMRRVLGRAVNAGSMSTSDVRAVPLTAQIAARLHTELGVSRVSVSQLARAGDATAITPGAFNDDGSSTKPLLTVLRFESNGRPREIAIMSYAFAADSEQRSSWPTNLLAELRPGGFAWSSISADGVGLFSADDANGLQRASRDLLGQIRPGGGVVLDYPQSDVYLEGGQSFGGMHFMRGRAPLDSYGARREAALPINKGERPFGYTGLHANDEVRVYRVGESGGEHAASWLRLDGWEPVEAPFVLEMPSPEPGSS